MAIFLYHIKEYNQLPEQARAERSPTMHKLIQSKSDTLWFIGYQVSIFMLLFLILIPFQANS